ncbi:hypothetical protein BLNAU_20769 [Blattamonas nauphoetae]|uniref:Uncharacterized protein n=1 Tax=Blattamonas nauphoetae TaxID=2049346 RepID=A0ABQ9WXU3_9EUKA|nr:hypothetical protein BLNAU_20769 [Blattamonas nauphoetae]
MVSIAETIGVLSRQSPSMVTHTLNLRRRHSRHRRVCRLSGHNEMTRDSRTQVDLHSVESTMRFNTSILHQNQNKPTDLMESSQN